MVVGGGGGGRRGGKEWVAMGFCLGSSRGHRMWAVGFVMAC